MPNYPFIHSTDLSNPAENLELLCAHDHPAQEVEWLWPGKIPIGKVSMIIGDPGMGKTLLALDIAARASRGDAMPDETVKSQELRDKSQTSNSGSRLLTLDSKLPSSTLILSATDDFQDTLRPRLDAAGADPRRIFYIPSITDLRHDIAQLRAAVSRAPNVRLIIIDPINAFVGPTDSHFHSVLRRVLEPLARLAAEKRIAVIAIAHLRKNVGTAIHRAAGSMGFVAAARSVWNVARDEDHPGRALFLPVKTNLTQSASGLAFTIEPSATNGAASLRWDPTPIDAPNNSPRRGEIADLHAARQWLAKALAEGPRAARDLTEEAAQFGFHARTLRRALHALGGETQFRDTFEGWWWSLPSALCAGLPTPHSDRPRVSSPSQGFQPVPLSPNPQSEIPNPKFPAPTTPVPSCPLPENNHIAPGTPPPPHDVETSIRTLDRLARRRTSHTRVVRGSPDPAPQTTAGLRDPKRANRPQQPPKTTGNPVLDDLLNSIRECVTAKPPDPPNHLPANPPDKLPPINQVTTRTSDDLPTDEKLLWPPFVGPKMESNTSLLAK